MAADWSAAEYAGQQKIILHIKWFVTVTETNSCHCNRDKQTERQTDRQADTHREINRQASRTQTDRETDRQIVRWTDKQSQPNNCTLCLKKKHPRRF